MKQLLIIAMAIVVWLLTIILKQHREKILVAGIIVISIVSGVYSFAYAEHILPVRDSKSQTFYDAEYAQTGEFPDAFLRLYLNGKTVYVKKDKVKLEEAEKKTYWLYAYYHMYNMTNYLNSVDANVISDESMNEDYVTSDKASDFECLGYTNDLLRNTMLYTKKDIECGNYFYFLNYYRDMSDTSYFYLNAQSLNDDEYVILWQERNEDDLITEDMYLMGKKYYEENIKK